MNAQKFPWIILKSILVKARLLKRWMTEILVYTMVLCSKTGMNQAYIKRQKNTRLSKTWIRLSILKPRQTIPFTGTGIRIYGLKSSDYGKALVTLDGKEMPSLDFYSSADYEKNVLIGEYTNLRNGDHILTLTVDPNSPDGRKMISLDSFDILKPSTLSLDTPSLAPIKAGDQTLTLTFPSGEWDAIAVHFPATKDPVFLKKSDEPHVTLSDGNQVLPIKDQQIELPIPETAH